MIAHVPEDMTVTVSAEATLAALQAELGKRGQWLPVDPPGAGELTIRALLDSNASGPRRYGFGTIREHLLGLQARLPGGRVVKAGGQVVKNVAGYDLCKLFVGAQGTLGTVLEATFKLRPLPEAEQAVAKRCRSLAEAGALIDKLVASPLLPVVFDLVSPATVVVGFAGNREEVDWQLAQARELGLSEPTGLDYDHAFPHQLSVLPSKLIETIQALGAGAFVARAGNGVVGTTAGPAADRSPPIQSSALPSIQRLEQRLQEAFGAHR